MARGRKRAATSRGKGKNKMRKKASETPVAFSSENTIPVVSSIGCLSPTDTTSNVLSPPAANVTNNASNDSLVEPNLLRNMANNFPIDTGIQTASDDEVQFIGVQRYVADNLNNNSSAVTNMNMRFPTAENNREIIENADLVASSIGSLPPTDTLSNVPSSSAENISKNLHLEKFLENLLECNPIDSKKQDELDGDDDVQFIGVHRDVEGAYFNPDTILPMLMKQHPELKEIVERARYVSDAFTIQFYATLNKGCNNVGMYSKLCVELRKCKSQLEKALQENERLKSLVIPEAEYRELEKRNEELGSQIEQIRNNATMIISNLRSAISKNIEERLEAQYLTTFNEKSESLRDAEEKVKNLQEAIRCLKKEIEDSTMFKQRIEEKLNAAKLQISPRIISEYKRKHYCCVCDMPAAIVCCLNTSYCGSKCQERQAEEHGKHCKTQR